MTLADVDRDDRIGDLFVEALLSKVSNRNLPGSDPFSARSLSNVPVSGSYEWSPLKFHEYADHSAPRGSWPAPPAVTRQYRLEAAKRAAKKRDKCL